MLDKIQTSQEIENPASFELPFKIRKIQRKQNFQEKLLSGSESTAHVKSEQMSGKKLTYQEDKN
jgi:hypothetical protein